MTKEEARKQILNQIKAQAFGCFSHDNDAIDIILEQYASTKAEETAIGFIQWYFKQFPATEVQNELYYKKAYKQYKQQ